MKAEPELSWTAITGAVIVGWLGWVSITVIELEKEVAVLNARLKISQTAAVASQKPPIYARFGFPVPDLVPPKEKK